jgi:UDP-N-acetylmuramyl tripeptide synthase
MTDAVVPFTDSRRLTGPNLYFDHCGAVLESTAPPRPVEVAAWLRHVGKARRRLGWPEAPVLVRAHAGGAALAFAAPLDQLLTATEVNEWAWCAAREVHVLHAPGHPASWDEALAWHTLERLAAAERDPAFLALVATAETHGAALLWDDDGVSLGLGVSARCWPRDALPDPAALDWSRFGRIPVALVTGSNGKTTSVRLLAACCRAAGRCTAWNCTDGLYLDGAPIEAGDWSGPAGARAVLRHPEAQAAVLETARGGILRRGLAFAEADVALVTNISADHFGEYGIDDLDALAEAKLVVARGLRAGGTLVLNADDPVLSRHAPADVRVAWFSLRGADACSSGDACWLADGQLWLRCDGALAALGAVADMPLSVNAAARYNIANLAGAALAAAALGIGIDAIRQVLLRFGLRHEDNPGRLQRFSRNGIEVLVDYAHNPDGLRGLLEVAAALRSGAGRLGLVLGQAGNRSDDDVRALASVAAGFAPDFVVLKDLDGYLRGRQPGEVPALLREALLAAGMAPPTIVTVLSEVDAARTLLDWGRSGDVLVLPVHALAAREAVLSLLSRSPPVAITPPVR